MYSIPTQIYEYVEKEFKILSEELFDKPFTSESLNEFRRKVTVLGIETGMTDDGRNIQVLVEPAKRRALFFVEE